MTFRVYKEKYIGPGANGAGLFDDELLYRKPGHGHVEVDVFTEGQFGREDYVIEMKSDRWTVQIGAQDIDKLFEALADTHRWGHAITYAVKEQAIAARRRRGQESCFPASRRDD